MTTLEKDYIKYHLSRSKETFEDAQMLAEKEHWNSRVNRLYYACFYVVSALLCKHKINTKTHSGLNSQFGLHFVKTGKVTYENGTLLSNLTRWRFEGDYDDLFDFDKETVVPLLPEVKKFLHDIEKLIIANGTKSKTS